MIKVSVCITTYNLEKYIEQTLNSILSQKTSFDFEILVGDDCSTDGTKEILLVYKEKYPDRIKLHLQQKNVGVNRNDFDLIYLAQGEYIAWCDGDDYWIDQYKLEKQVQFLDENPRYSCVHTLWKDFYEQSGVFHDVDFEQYAWEQELTGQLYIERLLLQGHSGFRFSSIMFRKKIVIDALNQDPIILIGVDHLQNDFAIFCLLVYVAPPFLMREKTVVYRIRSESLSITNSYYKRYKYCLKSLNLTIYLLRKYNISFEIVQRVLHSRVSSLLYSVYNNIKWIDDFKVIQQQLDHVGYKYSLGQKTIILSFKYSCFRPIVRFLLRWVVKNANY